MEILTQDIIEIVAFDILRIKLINRKFLEITYIKGLIKSRFK